MKTVKVRQVTIGTGMPKICIPVVGKTEQEIYQEAERISKYPADMAELRIDWFEEVKNTERVLQVMRNVRKIFTDIPVLFTFRSLREGGETAISLEQYCALLIDVAEEKQADMIDVEIFFEGIPHGKDDSACPKQQDGKIPWLIDRLHESGMLVVGSNHDFVKTPVQQEIIRRLCIMQDWNADIVKIAVMPQCERDVLVLLSATEQMKNLHARVPVITMSMGTQGMISRLTGEVFGSAVTFASAGRSSAPGQMEVKKLQQILEILHG